MASFNNHVSEASVQPSHTII